MLVTSNFSFSHSVFKRLISQGRQKVSLLWNGLKAWSNQADRRVMDRNSFYSFVSIIYVCYLSGEFANNNLKFDGNDSKFSKRVENTARKGEIARCEQFLFFSLCFQKTSTADTYKPGKG